jgi:hypothetical protein
MGIQTATTGNLENAQNIILAQSRYTAEHNAPCIGLIEHFTLANGAKQLTVPKVGQMTMSNLTDGVDMVATQDIGLTTTDLTTGEVGGKVILTDKLLRQFNEDVFKMIGRQLGDAAARKKNRDIIALFSALNGATTLGEDNKYLSMQNAQGCVAFSKSHKYPSPIYVVHHPNAIAYLTGATANIGSTYYLGIMGGLNEEIMRNFWKFQMSGVNFFETGDIDVVSGADSGYGAIFSKSAMCIIDSIDWTTERERDASLRAWEVNMVADYGVFELDDTYGAPMLYEIGEIGTTV